MIHFRPPTKRSDDLPAKFTAAERTAYDWLWDCGVAGWSLDLKTKQVRTEARTYPSIVALRESLEEE